MGVGGIYLYASPKQRLRVTEWVCLPLSVSSEHLRQRC